MKGRRAPAVMLIPAGVAVAFLVLPLVGLLSRTPWGDLGDLLTSSVVVEAVALSLLVSVAAVGLSLIVGVPLAWVLARVDFWGKSTVRGLALLPLVLPPVVGGAALLFAYGRSGLVGEPLYEWTGLTLPFSTLGVVIAVTFVSMPFLIITVEGALRTLDPRFEGAARTLGQGDWTVFRRVTLPMIRPALLAGVVLTWARAIGEFGATLAFAGNLPGETQTLPLAVFVALETDRDAAVAISLLMVVISLVVLVALRDRWLQR